MSGCCSALYEYLTLKINDSLHLHHYWNSTHHSNQLKIVAPKSYIRSPDRIPVINEVLSYSFGSAVIISARLC